MDDTPLLITQRFEEDEATELDESSWDNISLSASLSGT